MQYTVQVHGYISWELWRLIMNYRQILQHTNCGIGDEHEVAGLEEFPFFDRDEECGYEHEQRAERERRDEHLAARRSPLDRLVRLPLERSDWPTYLRCSFTRFRCRWASRAVGLEVRVHRHRATTSDRTLVAGDIRFIGEGPIADCRPRSGPLSLRRHGPQTAAAQRSNRTPATLWPSGPRRPPRGRRSGPKPATYGADCSDGAGHSLEREVGSEPPHAAHRDHHQRQPEHRDHHRDHLAFDSAWRDVPVTYMQFNSVLLNNCLT